jgi:hypothetical protein
LSYTITYMKWARRQYKTGHKQKLYITSVAVFVLVALISPLFVATPASAASINPAASATTTFAAATPEIDPCDASGFNLSWVVCPLVNMMHQGTKVMDAAINHLMRVDATSIFDRKTDSGKAYYAAWNSFRIFGIALIVIAGLVMVISQAMGFDLFDAYTVKKVLPRLVLAIIGISLSWWLMWFLTNLTNDVGTGIRSIIYYPFRGLAGDSGIQSLGSSSLEALAVGGGILFLGIGGILSLIATAALAALVAFLVLVIRQIVIVFLILVAPLAIACYVLPNTEKVYKLWWDSLSKALMMFPIIAAFIATGHVFSAVASSSTTGSYGLSDVVAVLAYFLPYFALPFTFRLAGGALATLGGLTNDRSRGAFDRLRNYRKGQAEQRMGYYGQRVGDRTAQARAEAVRKLNSSASGKGRLAGGAMRFAGSRIAGLGGIEHKMSAINARTGKAINDEIATGRDDRIRGLTVDRSMGFEAARAAGRAQVTSDGRRQWMSLGGRMIDESDVIEGQKLWGHDVAAQQAALSYEMRKANSEEEVRGIAKNYHSLATKQWGQTETQAAGSWIGASFENQNQHLEYKNSDWQTGELKSDTNGLRGVGLIDEVYEKRGSYNMAQMGSNTIAQLIEADKTAENILTDPNASTEARAKADDQRKKIAAISETFMHQLTGAGGDMDEAALAEAMSRGGRSGARQANTPGSAHTSERVVELAKRTGRYNAPPANTISPDSPQS